jgi:hypothetical protein
MVASVDRVSIYISTIGKLLYCQYLLQTYVRIGIFNPKEFHSLLRYWHSVVCRSRPHFMYNMICSYLLSSIRPSHLRTGLFNPGLSRFGRIHSQIFYPIHFLHNKIEHIYLIICNFIKLHGTDTK